MSYWTDFAKLATALDIPLSTRVKPSAYILPARAAVDSSASCPAGRMLSLESSSNPERRGLLAAVRNRLRFRARRVRATEDADSDVGPVVLRTVDAPSRPVAPDHELEQIAAEARYHGDRLALYRARMHRAVNGTSLTRLRELERIATAARERLRHARRARSGE